jgi:putative tricarboxylic transport membrane protein
VARRIAWGDLVLSAGFAAIGLVWVLGARAMPMWERETPGPGWLPFAFGALLIALSLAAGIEALRSPPPEGTEPPGGVRKPLLVLGATLAAVLGIETVGFAPAMFLMLLVLFALAERKPVLTSALVAAAVAGALHVIFAVWLAVPLPTGFFGS